MTMPRCRTWLCAAWLAVAPLWAIAHPLCPRPIVVGFYESGAHFDSGTGSGIDADLVQALAQRSGCSMQAEYLSRVLIWRRMETAQLDMTVSALATVERQRYAEFLPYMQSRNVLLMRADAKPIASPAEFEAHPSLRLGVVKGYRYGLGWDDWIEHMRQAGRADSAGDLPALLRQLDNGRIHAFPVIPTMLPGLLAQRGEQAPALQTQAWFSQFPKQESCLALSRSRLSPELRRHLASAMEQLRREGVLTQILQKHLRAEDVRAALLPGS